MRTLRRVVASALALAACFAASGPACAGCPLTEMQWNGIEPFVSEEATFDTVGVEGRALGFDVPAGHLELASWGKFDTHVRVRDTFLVQGAPLGTPVLGVLELVAEGTVSTWGCGGSNCWGYLTVRVDAGDAGGVDTDGKNVFGGSVPARADVAVPIVFISGVPKDVFVELAGSGSADHGTTATATYRFSGLPNGVGVASCRGFVHAPTPAVAASWGRVKAAYHR